MGPLAQLPWKTPCLILSDVRLRGPAYTFVMKFVTFLIMSAVFLSVLGQQANKVLKVPKIYNTVISTDDDLLPSLAYKAVSPVVKSVVPNFYPYFPYTEIAQSPFVLPAQEPYKSSYEPSPQNDLYSQQNIYNGLLRSLLALNNTIAMNVDSGAKKEPAVKGPSQRPTAGNNGNNRPDAPDSPLPSVYVGTQDRQTTERVDNEYPPAPLGYV